LIAAGSFDDNGMISFFEINEKIEKISHRLIESVEIEACPLEFGIISKKQKMFIAPFNSPFGVHEIQF